MTATTAADRSKALSDRPRALLTKVLIVLLATRLLHVDASTPPSSSPIRIVFPGPPSTLSLPYFVARKKGWLDGVPIKELYVTGDANATRILLSGDAEMATVALVNVFASLRAGAKIRAINSWQPMADYYLIAQKGGSRDVSDLIGKTFAGAGAGNMSDQLPRLIMRQHGLDDTKSRFLQVGGHSARLQAVLTGRAQAALVNTVTALEGERSGKVSIILRVSDDIPNLGYVWNIVRAESLSDRRLESAFQVLTTSGIRGARFIVDHPDEAAEILHERLPDLDPELLKTAILRLNAQKVWGVNGGLAPEVEERMTQLAVQLGNIATAVPSTDILDARFVDVSLKELR
jgi:NitT/TauT family transport system substrate-binding protein